MIMKKGIIGHECLSKKKETLNKGEIGKVGWGNPNPGLILFLFFFYKENFYHIRYI